MEKKGRVIALDGEEFWVAWTLLLVVFGLPWKEKKTDVSLHHCTWKDHFRVKTKPNSSFCNRTSSSGSAQDEELTYWLLLVFVAPRPSHSSLTWWLVLFPHILSFQVSISFLFNSQLFSFITVFVPSLWFEVLFPFYFMLNLKTVFILFVILPLCRVLIYFLKIGCWAHSRLSPSFAIGAHCPP